MAGDSNEEQTEYKYELSGKTGTLMVVVVVMVGRW